MENCRLQDKNHRLNAFALDDVLDMRALARLSLSPQLRALSISMGNNQVEDEGAVMLINHLHYASHLEHIIVDISQNLVSPAGVVRSGNDYIVVCCHFDSFNRYRVGGAILFNPHTGDWMTNLLASKALDG
jgi:hypothetical protein